MSSDQPFVVGIGGTTRATSSTEQALRAALGAADAAGARTRLFTGEECARIALYDPEVGLDGPVATELVEAVRTCDGLILASPGYHGTVSGLVKNAVDVLEELRTDGRPYLTGRAVGCIATAYGWQAAVSTLATLRTIVHALRGWPTPLGAAVNTTGGETFDDDGGVIDERVSFQLSTVGTEVVQLARVLAQPAQ